jgi:predicted tellurium resistance membrane protein TerC
VLLLLSITWISNSRSRSSRCSVKMLALSFLLLIGVTLVAESFDQHIPQGYIYSAMAFSLFVEMLNLRAHRAEDEEPVHLHGMPHAADTPNEATR